MSDVNISATLQLSKGNLSESFSRSGTAAVSTAGILVQTLTVGTNPVQITTTTLGVLGFAFAQSLVTTTQSTCTVSVGRLVSGTLHESHVMKPGEFFVSRLAPGSYAAKGAAEGYRLQIAVLED